MRIVKITTSTRGFFHHWVEFTRPIHKLGKMQKKILAEFLYHRYLLSLEVSSTALIRKLLFNIDIKRSIADSVNTNIKRIDSILAEFRKAGIIKNKDIINSYIPKLDIGDKENILAFKFNLTDNEQGVFKDKVSQKVTEDS